jgi:hypothetical protein
VRNRIKAVVPAVMAVGFFSSACGAPESDFGKDPSWEQEFGISECELAPTGRSQYFILEPGFQLVLEGGSEKVAITVLDETKTITGVVDEAKTATTVTTRVVEEKEWKDDELVEVSRNFFAICPTTNDVFYFGEEVDDYNCRRRGTRPSRDRESRRDARDSSGFILEQPQDAGRHSSESQ